MTTKRDSKRKPKKAEKPKVKKETLKDLDPGTQSDELKGGTAGRTSGKVTYCGAC